MNRVRAIAADDLFALMETAVARCPAELFRPYRYRLGLGPARLAELRAIDEAECAACRDKGWPCPRHRVPDCADRRAFRPCRDRRHCGGSDASLGLAG